MTFRPQHLVYTLGFALIGACNTSPQSNVSFDTTAMFAQAALEGLELGTVEVVVSAEDLESERVIALSADDTFEIEIPSGTDRTFRLRAFQNVQSGIEEVGEVPVAVFLGDVTVDLPPGEFDLELPVEAAGAVLAEINLLGGSANLDDLQLRYEIGAEVFETNIDGNGRALIQLPVNTYTANLIVDIPEHDYLAVSDPVVVSQGRLSVHNILIYPQAELCGILNEEGIENIDVTCRSLEILTSGVDDFSVRVSINNGPELLIDTDRSTLYPQQFSDGTAFDVQVFAPSSHQCTANPDNGVINAATNTITIVCVESSVGGSGTVSGFLYPYVGSNISLTLFSTSASVNETLNLGPNSAINFGSVLPIGADFTVISTQPTAVGPEGAAFCNTNYISGTFTGDVTDLVVGCLNVPEPVYSASNFGEPYGFNSYVRNDGPDIHDYFDDSDTVCDGSEAGDFFSSCIHAGEVRMISLPWLDSCSGLSVTDALNWFEWECDDDGGEVKLRTQRLNPGIGMREMLFPDGSGFIPNVVTIEDSAGNSYLTGQSPWWSNNVLLASAADFNSGGLDLGGLSGVGPGSVVLIDSAPTNTDARLSNFSFDSLSIVGLSGVVLFGDGEFSAVDIQRPFNYLQVDIDTVDNGIDSQAVVHLENSHHTQIVKTQLIPRPSPPGYHAGDGLRLNNAQKNLVVDSRFGNTFNAAVIEGSSHGNVFENLNLDFTQNHCLDLRPGADANVFFNLRAHSCSYQADAVLGSRFPNGNVAIFVSSDSNRFDHLEIANTGGAGVEITGQRNQLFNSKIFSTGGSPATFPGLQINGGRDTIIVGGLVALNERGIEIVGGGSNVLSHISILDNSSIGLEIRDAGATDNLLTNLWIEKRNPISPSGTGLILGDSSDNTRIQNIAVNGYFTGASSSMTTGSFNQYGHFFLRGSQPCDAGAGGGPFGGSDCGDPSFDVDASMAPQGFIGFVFAFDADNASADSSGQAFNTGDLDWFSFEPGTERSWGSANSTEVAGCGDGINCQIIDYLNAPAGNVRHTGTARFDAQATLPDVLSSVDFYTHLWSEMDEGFGCSIPGAINPSSPSPGPCQSTFLVGSLQSSLDLLYLDGNGLCEMGETCQLTNDIGNFKFNPVATPVIGFNAESTGIILLD